VVSDSGAVLRTDRLFWDREKRRIYTDTLAILTTELDSLHGYELEANDDLTSWSMKRPTGHTFRNRNR
ncbi:MAG: hypothetical protein ABH878_00195, partial [bacterium]